MPKAAPRHRPMARIAPVHHVPEAVGDSWRAGKSSTQRGYGSRWQRARLTFLKRAENVLCRMCSARGLVVLAAVVDHVVPHRGDQSLFWDTSNWQALCKPCHDGAKQREERAAAHGRRQRIYPQES